MFGELSFQGWPQFMKLAIPTTFLCCLEWWAFEFIVLFSGILGVRELAAQVAIINSAAFIFMVPLGLQFAVSGLVGNLLGQQQPK